MKYWNHIITGLIGIAVITDVLTGQKSPTESIGFMLFFLILDLLIETLKGKRPHA